MSGRKLIANLFDEIDRRYDDNKTYSRPEWTEFIGVALDHTAAKMSLKLTRKRVAGNLDSGENLTIDVMLFDKSAWKKLYKRDSDYDAFILPEAVIELENMDDKSRIAYSLWKLLCIRSPLRILICYQNNENTIDKLIMYLREVVIKGNLKKDDKGELFIIVGNEGIDENESWERYWQVYKWSRDDFH
jgi:hypothetical protein